MLKRFLDYDNFFMKIIVGVICFFVFICFFALGIYGVMQIGVYIFSEVRSIWVLIRGFLCISIIYGFFFALSE